jgi:hypothetical protein
MVSQLATLRFQFPSVAICPLTVEYLFFSHAIAEAHRSKFHNRLIHIHTLLWKLQLHLPSVHEELNFAHRPLLRPNCTLHRFPPTCVTPPPPSPSSSPPSPLLRPSRSASLAQASPEPPYWTSRRKSSRR